MTGLGHIGLNSTDPARDEAFRRSLRARIPASAIELKICEAFSECLKKYGQIPA